MKTEITLKELFERLIQLETKLDMQTETNKRTVYYFRNWAILVGLLEIFNLIVHSYSIWGTK